MGERTAILLVNYNMGERTDALCEAIAARVKVPHDTLIIDNGSTGYLSKYTTLKIKPNIQTTGGWLEGLRYIRNAGYTSYWFMITSAEFPTAEYDPLAPMLELLRAGAVGVHPALTRDSTTSWLHLIDRGTGKPRQTWMIDNIASLYDAEWFDSIGWFDPALLYAWGIDLETCWKARRERRALYIDERTQIKKVTNIGYAMNRMGMTAEQREERAGNNMAAVLKARYGADWWQRMTREFVTEEMK
jgi:GT2 family glycosyltransferase